MSDRPVPLIEQRSRPSSRSGDPPDTIEMLSPARRGPRLDAVLGCVLAFVALLSESLTEAHRVGNSDLAFGLPWIALPGLRNNGHVTPLQNQKMKPAVLTIPDKEAEELLAPLSRPAREFRIKREMPEHTFRSGVGVIAFVTNPKYPGAILLGKRKGGSGEGTWSLPGGHLEVGESFEECARREVLEETDLELSNIRFAAVNNAIDLPERFHYVVAFVTAETTEEPINMEEDRCDGWHWVQWNAEDFPSPLFVPLQNLRDEGFNPFDLERSRNSWDPAPHRTALRSNLHEAARHIGKSVHSLASSFAGPQPFWNEASKENTADRH